MKLAAKDIIQHHNSGGFNRGIARIDSDICLGCDVWTINEILHNRILILTSDYIIGLIRERN
jgi:hypothetical protein